MQNNVGIYASQISGHLWAPNGAMDALATVTVGSTALATITFAGIPQGYRNLEIRAISRCTQAAGGSDMWIRFNGDTGSNYSYHLLQGNGSSAVAASGSSQTYIRNQSTVDGSYSNIFQASIFTITDYASTSKNKTLRGLTGFDANGDGHIRELSGAWYNSSSAITSIDIIANGTTFSQYSQFALFGVK
jgi:hypothetical protein